MSSFNEQIEIDHQNAVDREDELAEEIEQLAISKMRKGGEFDPFSPENFSEALQEAPDCSMLHKAVMRAEALTESVVKGDADIYETAKILSCRAYGELVGLVRNYWNELAMNAAAKEIGERTK